MFNQKYTFPAQVSQNLFLLLANKEPDWYSFSKDVQKGVF